jgi:hypothetical protein
MRASVLSVLLALAAGAAACGSPCQDLADRICNCQPAGTVRDSCKASVSNQIGGSGQHPVDADQKRCQELLATCPDPASNANQCDILQTEEGKIACGLAYSPDSGS